MMSFVSGLFLRCSPFLRGLVYRSFVGAPPERSAPPSAQAFAFCGWMDGGAACPDWLPSDERALLEAGRTVPDRAILEVLLLIQAKAQLRWTILQGVAFPMCLLLGLLLVLAVYPYRPF